MISRYCPHRDVLLLVIIITANFILKSSSFDRHHHHKTTYHQNPRSQHMTSFSYSSTFERRKPNLSLFAVKKTEYAKVPPRRNKRSTKPNVTKKNKTKRAAPTKKRKMKSKDDDQMIDPVHYWESDSDEFIWKNSSFFFSSTGKNTNHTIQFEKLTRFVICGNPTPLARHRTYRGYQFNPSAKKQQQFKDVLVNMTKSTNNNIGNNSLLLFPEGEYLAATILFRLKRPKNHFISNTPGKGRLKAKSPDFLHPSRSDIDNLVKFVLDAFNGILYSDDKQIVRLCTTKVLDSEGNCTGATDIIFHSVDDNVMNELLTHKTFPTYTDDLLKY